jgi:hypothetical protein
MQFNADIRRLATLDAEQFVATVDSEPRLLDKIVNDFATGCFLPTNEEAQTFANNLDRLQKSAKGPNQGQLLSAINNIITTLSLPLPCNHALVVGDQRILVNKERLIFISPYFAALWKGGMREGSCTAFETRLLEVDPESLKLAWDLIIDKESAMQPLDIKRLALLTELVIRFFLLENSEVRARFEKVAIKSIKNLELDCDQAIELLDALQPLLQTDSCKDVTRLFADMSIAHLKAEERLLPLVACVCRLSKKVPVDKVTAVASHLIEQSEDILKTAVVLGPIVHMNDLMLSNHQLQDAIWEALQKELADPNCNLEPYFEVAFVKNSDWLLVKSLARSEKLLLANFTESFLKNILHLFDLCQQLNSVYKVRIMNQAGILLQAFPLPWAKERAKEIFTELAYGNDTDYDDVVSKWIKTNALVFLANRARLEGKSSDAKAILLQSSELIAERLLIQILIEDEQKIQEAWNLAGDDHRLKEYIACYTNREFQDSVASGNWHAIEVFIERVRVGQVGPPDYPHIFNPVSSIFKDILLKIPVRCRNRLYIKNFSAYQYLFLGDDHCLIWQRVLKAVKAANVSELESIPFVPDAQFWTYRHEGKTILEHTAAACTVSKDASASQQIFIKLYTQYASFLGQDNAQALLSAIIQAGVIAGEAIKEPLIHVIKSHSTLFAACCHSTTLAVVPLIKERFFAKALVDVGYYVHVLAKVCTIKNSHSFGIWRREGLYIPIDGEDQEWYQFCHGRWTENSGYCIWAEGREGNKVAGTSFAMLVNNYEQEFFSWIFSDHEKSSELRLIAQEWFEEAVDLGERNQVGQQFWYALGAFMHSMFQYSPFRAGNEICTRILISAILMRFELKLPENIERIDRFAYSMQRDDFVQNVFIPRVGLG